MFFNHQLKSITHEASNGPSVAFMGGPKKRGAWPVYIRSLEVLSLLTLDTGAGGDTLPVELHGMRSVELTDGDPWGPQKVRGDDLAALDFLHSGEVIPYQDGNGDATIAASQADAVRTISTFYDFGNFGARDDDFAPAYAAFNAQGSVIIHGEANPTNVSSTNTTASTHRPRLELIAKPEIVAVPRVITKAVKVTGEDQEINFRGKLVSVMVRNNADEIAADLTKLTLDANGFQLSNGIDPNMKSVRGLNYANTEVTTARLQRHFCETVGGTEPRYTRLWPWRKGMPVSYMPEGPLVAKLEGSETMTNYTVILTYIQPLTREEILKQCEAIGVDRGELEAKIASKGFDEVFRQKSASKVDVSRSSMLGYGPMKLIDEDLVRAYGLPVD